MIKETLVGKMNNSGQGTWSQSAWHSWHMILHFFPGAHPPPIVEKLGISLSMAGLLPVIQKVLLFTIPLLASSYLMLADLLFVTGLSSTLFLIPSPVIISHISDNELDKGMCFFMVGGELARILDPLIIVAAVTHWELEGSYKLIPVSLLATVIFFYKLRNIDLIEDSQINKSHVSHTFTLTLYLSVYLTDKGNSLWFSGLLYRLYSLPV